MAYEASGMAAMFPIYLSRLRDEALSRDDYDIAVAQNEVNLNQNLETICQKILELEAYLSQSQA